MLDKPLIRLRVRLFVDLRHGEVRLEISHTIAEAGVGGGTLFTYMRLKASRSEPPAPLGFWGASTLILAPTSMTHDVLAREIYAQPIWGYFEHSTPEARGR